MAFSLQAFKGVYRRHVGIELGHEASQVGEVFAGQLVPQDPSGFSFSVLVWCHVDTPSRCSSR